jgi:hypothetical protein
VNPFYAGAANGGLEPRVQFFRIAAKDRFVASLYINFMRGFLLRRVRGEKVLLNLGCLRESLDLFLRHRRFDKFQHLL